MRARLIGFVVIALIALVSMTGGANAAPKLVNGEGGGVSPLCMAASAADAPTTGRAYVGNENFAVLYSNGQATAIHIAAEGHVPHNSGPAIINDQGSDALPACGNSVIANVSDSNVAFTSTGACFARIDGAGPNNIACAMP